MEIPQIEQLFDHETAIAVEDIPTIELTETGLVLTKGVDYTYRIVRNMYDPVEVSTVDTNGDYYIEVTGIGNYFGVAYRYITVKDPTSLYYADIDSKQFVKASDANKNPINTVTLDGAPLQEGKDYAVYYCKTNEYGYDSESLDNQPTEVGYYTFKIGWVEGTEYQSGSSEINYVIVPDDYAGVITKDCITLNGKSVDEFKSEKQRVVDSEEPIDVEITVNGTTLQKGIDYSVGLNSEYGELWNGDNNITITDLRTPTIGNARDGIVIDFECEVIYDLAYFKPYGAYTYKYTGDPISIYQVTVVDRHGNTRGLFKDQTVTMKFFDSAGNEISAPVEVGTYSMELTAIEKEHDDYSEFYVGSVTFPFEVRDGTNITQWDWEWLIPELDDLYYDSQAVTIDIQTMQREHSSETVTVGEDFTYRIVKKIGDVDAATIDHEGYYYLEITGINDYFGVFYREFYVKDAHNLEHAEVDSKPFVKVGDSNKNPIDNVTINGAPLTFGQDYAVQWFESNESGYDLTELEEQPSELGYYVFRICQIEDEDGQPTTDYYGSTWDQYFSIVPDDYAGAITPDCVTVNGVKGSEVESANILVPEDEFVFDVSVVVDGKPLVAGTDYSVEYRDSHNQPITVPNDNNRDTIITIKDLREYTTADAKRGYVWQCTYVPVFDLSKADVLNINLDKQYTGRPIDNYFSIVVQSKSTGKQKRIYPYYVTIVNYTDQSGNVVTPIEKGTYTCTIRANENEETLTGETSFSFKIRDGVDLSRGSYKLGFFDSADELSVFFNADGDKLPTVKHMIETQRDMSLDLSKLSFELVKDLGDGLYEPTSLNGYGYYLVRVTGTGDYFNQAILGATYCSDHDLQGAKVEYNSPVYKSEGNYVPTFKVTENGAELEEGVDYRIRYDYSTVIPTTVGPHDFQIVGTGTEESGYYGTYYGSYWLREPYSIDGHDISTSLDLAYTGQAVTHEGMSLYVMDEEGHTHMLRPDNYELSYADADGAAIEAPVEAGTYSLTITGKNAFTGSATRTFNVSKGKVNLADYQSAIRLPDLDGLLYHEGDQQPVIKRALLPDGTELIAGSDFTYRYVTSLWSDEVSMQVVSDGQYCIELQGIGNYYGVVSEYSKVIAPANSIGAAQVNFKDVVRIGVDNLKPVLGVVLDGKPLIEGTDYSIEYYTVASNGDYGQKLDAMPSEAGAYIARLVGLGTEGSGVVGTYEYLPYKVCANNDIAAALVQINEKVKPGENPVVSVELDGKALAEGTDYVVECYSRDPYGDITAKLDGIPTTPGLYGLRLNADAAAGSQYVGQNGMLRFYVRPVNDLAFADIEIQREVAPGENPLKSISFNGKQLVKGTDYDRVPNVGVRGRFEKEAAIA